MKLFEELSIISKNVEQIENENSELKKENSFLKKKKTNTANNNNLNTNIKNKSIKPKVHTHVLPVPPVPPGGFVKQIKEEKKITCNKSE